MDNLIIRDAEVFNSNFSGRERKYNREGDRNFCVMLPDDWDWERLKADGWNIKEYFEKNGESIVPTGRHFISGVRINFNYYDPPIIHYISNGKEIVLTEELLAGSIAAQLDSRGAERIDLSIRPSAWTTNTGSGIKGYVDEMRIIAKPSLFDSDVDFETEELPFN